MGNTNTLPIVSQIKSGVQLLTGDVEGAADTQEKFLHECPIVAQATSLCYAVAGNGEKFLETNMRSVQTISNVADGVPVVGHVKGAIHYMVGDAEGGKNAMKSATRTTTVLGGGVGGFLVGGPVGAVAGGIAGGATWDTGSTGVSSLVHNEYRPNGVFAAVGNVVENPNAGTIFDLVAGPVFDGVAGYGAGQITAKVQTCMAQMKSNQMANARLSALEIQRDVLGERLEINRKSMTTAETLDLGNQIKPITKEINNIRTSLGKGEPFVDPKTTYKPQATIPKGSTVAAGTVTQERTEIYRILEINEDLPDEKYLEEAITKCAGNFEFLLKELTKDAKKKMAETAKRYAKKVRTQVNAKSKTRRMTGKNSESESDKESDSDEEDSDKIKCIHWNACGLQAQTKVDYGFIIYVLFENPDVIMLNELKVQTNEMVDLVQGIGRVLGYEALYVPSVGKPASRGSAILYKKNSSKVKLKMDNEPIIKQDLWHEGKPGIELIAADFSFEPRATRNNPAPHFYRFIECYIVSDTDEAFEKATEWFQELSQDNTTIITGDLNFHKNEWLQKWKDDGFVDTLDPTWKTNRHGTTRTAIDYVMTRKGDESHVISHVPCEPLGTHIHFILPFDVSPEIGPGPCSDLSCLTCIVGKASQLL